MSVVLSFLSTILMPNFKPHNSLSHRKLTFHADLSKEVMWKVFFSRQCIINHGFILVKCIISKPRRDMLHHTSAPTLLMME
jgi:hypothetical protein